MGVLVGGAVLLGWAFGAKVGITFFAISSVVLLVAVAWGDAASLSRMDLERQRAEGAVHEPERQYRLIFATNPLPTWVYDLETLRFLDVNDAAVEKYGYSRDEFLGMTIKDIRPADDVPRLMSTLETVRSGGEAPAAWRHVHKDGKLIEVEISSRDMQLNGKPSRIVVALDVTERNAAQEQLRQSESRLRESQRIAQVGSWEWDVATGRIVWSDEMYGLLGLERGRFQPGFEAFMELVHPEDRDGLRRTVDEALRTRESMATEYRVRRPDGVLRVHHARGQVLLGADSLPARMIGTAQDITDLKKLQDQLRQAQKMEAVGQLAGGVAHDFNNLLAVIAGHCGLLLKGLELGHGGIRRVEEIQRAADRAASLTRQLLAFSRKQVLQPQVFNLNTAVADVERMLHRLIGEHIEIRSVLAPDLDPVRVDPGQIEQVILNLAVNARDAMPSGGTLILETRNVRLDSIFLGGQPTLQPGPYVLLAVSDTGHGMDQDTLGRAFEPFFTTKEQGKGTGLGLSTVYGIVQQSGGIIQGYSEPGRGTTFKVYLPRAAARAERAAPAAAEAAPGGSETIVVVEDAEALRVLVREILESGGYMVLDGAGPEEALLAARAHPGPVHLLLTDVVMPRMSGREVAATLHRERPHVPVLYMSGYTDEALGQHDLMESGLMFLQKPFTSDDLLRKVREVLDGAGPTTEASA